MIISQPLIYTDLWSQHLPVWWTHTLNICVPAVYWQCGTMSIWIQGNHHPPCRWHVSETYQIPISHALNMGAFICVMHIHFTAFKSLIPPNGEWQSLWGFEHFNASWECWTPQSSHPVILFVSLVPDRQNMKSSLVSYKWLILQKQEIDIFNYPTPGSGLSLLFSHKFSPVLLSWYLALQSPQRWPNRGRTSCKINCVCKEEVIHVHAEVIGYISLLIAC